jgi:hypothetical protein
VSYKKQELLTFRGLLGSHEAFAEVNVCCDLGVAWEYMGLKFRCEEEKHSTLSKKYTNIEIETRTCSYVATLGSSRYVPMHKLAYRLQEPT